MTYKNNNNLTINRPKSNRAYRVTFLACIRRTTHQVVYNTVQSIYVILSTVIIA